MKIVVSESKLSRMELITVVLGSSSFTVSNLEGAFNCSSQPSFAWLNLAVTLFAFVMLWRKL